ncbi:MAG: hypothetical protein ACI8ZO_000233 [Flavobacteriales bacterium]|jgi:hypothetical protein
MEIQRISNSYQISFANPFRLSYIRQPQKLAMEIKIKEGQISMVPNGPFRLEGDFEILAEGVVQEKKERISLCRCGESLKMPLCDGTHKKIGFKD